MFRKLIAESVYSGLNSGNNISTLPLDYITEKAYLIKFQGTVCRGIPTSGQEFNGPIVEW